MHQPIMPIFHSRAKCTLILNSLAYTLDMARCRRLRLFGLILAASLLLAAGTLGQGSGCVSSDSEPATHEQADATKLNIVSVEFSGQSPLSDEDRAQFANEIQSRPLLAQESQIDGKLFERVTEPIRQNLMNRGYFRVLLTPTPFLVRATPDALEYALRIEIESGPQFHVGSVRFANANPDHPSLVFDESVLRQKIPLADGEILDVSKLRDGLHAISRLYQGREYIDNSIEPEFDVRDAPAERPTIDIVFHIDEQLPYRVRNIRLLGLNPAAAMQLQAVLPQQIGDLFDGALWEEFFEHNKSLLPSDSSAFKNLKLSRSRRDRTLDIALDFRLCPENFQRRDISDIQLK